MLRRTVINKIKSAKCAFTLAELLVTVLLLGVLAFVAVPRLRPEILDRYKNQTLAQKIVTDLRLARNLAITDAAHNTQGFAVQMLGAPPFHGYEIVNLATGQIVSTHTISDKVTCSGGSSFKFGPLGNLLPGSNTHLLVSGGLKTSAISIITATGTIECVEN